MIALQDVEMQPECHHCAVVGNAGDLGALLDVRVSMAAVMTYQFQPLVDRMVDKYGWTQTEAKCVFEDTKRFLFLAGAGTDVIAPSPKIDDVWHNFILFTEDYLEFCKTKFGRFIHHRPRRKTDAPSGRNIVRDTLKLARAVFGELSPNWNFENADGTVIDANGKFGEFADGDCDAGGTPCNPSTNCQD